MKEKDRKERVRSYIDSKIVMHLSSSRCLSENKNFNVHLIISMKLLFPFFAF